MEYLGGYINTTSKMQWRNLKSWWTRELVLTSSKTRVTVLYKSLSKSIIYGVVQVTAAYASLG